MPFRGRKQPFSAYGEKPLAADEHGVGGLRDLNWSWLSIQGRLPKSELLPQRLGRGPGEEMGIIGAGTPLFVAPPPNLCSEKDPGLYKAQGPYSRGSPQDQRAQQLLSPMAAVQPGKLSPPGQTPT